MGWCERIRYRIAYAADQEAGSGDCLREVFIATLGEYPEANRGPKRSDLTASTCTLRW